MNPKLASLIAFIEDHDGCRVESSAEDILVVSSIASFGEGKSERVRETIPATLISAREWLGY